MKCIQIILILESASMRAQHELGILFDLVIYSCVVGFFLKNPLDREYNEK